MKFKSNIINNNTATINDIRSFACGGKVRKGEDGLYNRVAAREQKQQFWNDETDDNGDIYRVRRTGDQNVLAKKVKAMNIDGFDPSMYNMDPNQKFDRQRYRDRKAIAREQHPEWTRRQRKAWALRDYDNSVQLKDPGVMIPSQE